MDNLKATWGRVKASLFIFFTEFISPTFSIKRIIIDAMLLPILRKAAAPNEARQANNEWPDRS